MSLPPVAASSPFATSLAQFGISAGGCFPAPIQNPSNARTEKIGGQVRFENDNYRITMGDDNTVTIHNKNTGETYHAWGDPHMNIDGKHAFDFWGTTTFQLDDGTKVTIETTPWARDPSATLSSRVTITNGDYGVQVSGVDTNTVGDLRFDEAPHHGSVLDAVVDDGNVLHENPAGAGFLAIDRNGRIRAVDQQYINETDLKKGGALQARMAEAFQKLAGLMAVTFVGSFIGSLVGTAVAEKSSQPTPLPRFNPFEDGLIAVLSRHNPVLSWFAAVARN